MADLTPPEATPYLRVVRPRSGWVALDLAEIWEFRELLVTLASRDVRLRYRQTALGVGWVILQPLLGATIFAVVFGSVARLPSDGLPYLLFSYAGLLVWNAFSSALTRTSHSLVLNSHLISKVFFPRLLLPLSTLASPLIDFMVASVVMAILIATYAVPLGPGILLLPLLLLLVFTLALGLGLVAAALMVAYRDVQHMLPVLTQLLLYASPVAYPVSAVPHGLRPFYELNPLSSILEGARWCLLGSGHPSLAGLAYASALAGFAILAGVLFFKRAERGFADVI